MHLQNFEPSLTARTVDKHLAVETAGAGQGGVKDFRSVRRGKQYDAGRRVETIKLGEELIERLLFFIEAADAARLARATSASSSSIKMMQGAALRACAKRSRTRAAPTPANISTNSEPAIEKKETPASPATARASSVLPVPGGPTRRIPLGERAPRRPDDFGFLRKETIS
jgi:hypothetical protein